MIPSACQCLRMPSIFLALKFGSGRQPHAPGGPPKDLVPIYADRVGCVDLRVSQLVAAVDPSKELSLTSIDIYVSTARVQ